VPLVGLKNFEKTIAIVYLMQLEITMKKVKPQKIAMPSTPESLGLARDRYESAIRYLFDRPVPKQGESEWYWNIDEAEFDATPLEWVHIQTLIFANAATELVQYSDEQVGMGLNYIMNNAISNVPFAVLDAPLEDGLRMMRMLKRLWKECIGARLCHVQRPIGSSNDSLGFVCYMWFDVWPIFTNVRHIKEWREAMSDVLLSMLSVPCREVQIAALHGIGHNLTDLDCEVNVIERLQNYIANIPASDSDLRSYAEQAAMGRVL
jgi:hypothetical protein